MSLPANLCYCTNVHPGESLDEVRAALSAQTRAVRARVSPARPFDLGLRLSARAARELSETGARERFRHELAEEGFEVRTLNGFPFGAFHATRVKEAVYRPDWQEAERTAYTLDLVRALALLLPSGERGSISTVPGCFKPRLEADGEERIARALHEVVRELVELERTEGQHIVLALEPEPGCLLETISGAVDFFQRRLLAPGLLQESAKALGLPLPAAEHIVRRHLGVCLDACHAAVEFEPPLAAYRALCAAGITVPKIQVSAGLAVVAPGPELRAELARYDEPVYLHQVVVREDDELRRYLDLGEALASEAPGRGEWRVHFHVPVFHEKLGAFGSTQAELRELLAALGRERADVQLEVETYTWDVLPEELRGRPLVDAIALELEWTREAWESDA